jgi:hypothetical protein
MIHLSVAIGRFVEALFYAILRVAGAVTVVVLGMALAGFVLFMIARWLIARGRANRR